MSINVNDIVSVRDLPQRPAGLGDSVVGVPAGPGQPPFRTPVADLPVPAAVDARLTIVEQSQAAGILGYATLADRPAAGTAGLLVRVTNDPDANNNGTYRDTGSAWVKAADPTAQISADVTSLRAATEGTPAVALGMRAMLGEVGGQVSSEEVGIAAPAAGTTNMPSPE